MEQPEGESAGFSIGGKGFIGLGIDGTNRKDFWEYDPVLNTWTQKADFGGTARIRAAGLSIGEKGYMGTGNDGTYKVDFWEYYRPLILTYGPTGQQQIP